MEENVTNHNYFKKKIVFIKFGFLEHFPIYRCFRLTCSGGTGNITITHSVASVTDIITILFLCIQFQLHIVAFN